MRVRTWPRQLIAVASVLVLPACGSGLVQGSVVDGMARVVNRGNVRLFSGNYNLVSVGDEPVPVAIPVGNVTGTACRQGVASARIVAGRMVIGQTETNLEEWRGNLEYYESTELTCRGETRPRRYNTHAHGRYRVNIAVLRDLVRVYFAETGATLTLERRGRELVLDPQEYIYKRGDAPADTLTTQPSTPTRHARP